ncbi:hypothetical protein LFL96_36380 (plasmid) [Paraburkholderia sp. D15]|uniref:hypothetical protein n=1 Tax=Paraburkholderia sp. D15 TaxID=2880218 RepID=UPI00247A35B0|nr:hypothetical protein [Paraburkholderia sp. D15]WGS54964.1 hypothetical protein LFL96_36380 [Paraburkholderia sp. D15]
MATTPNEGENPIHPDQSDVAQTDLPDLGPASDPDASPPDPDEDPDVEDKEP